MAAKPAVEISCGLALEFVEAFEKMMEAAYRINEAHGWHNPAPTDGEAVALVHTEASEIMEYLRQGVETPDDKIPPYRGVEAEGADVVIRLMSWYRRRHWDLANAIVEKMRYNAQRPYRHGNKAL